MLYTVETHLLSLPIQKSLWIKMRRFLKRPGKTGQVHGGPVNESRLRFEIWHKFLK